MLFLNGKPENGITPERMVICMPESLTELSCLQFSEQLASKAPVPGGGGTAALIGALAAGLGCMAANLTVGKKKYLPYEEDHIRIIARCSGLRQRFLELVDEDAAAFEPLSAAYSMDKNDPTAVFKSVSKLPTHEITGGVLLNQKVTPVLLSTVENTKNL